MHSAPTALQDMIKRALEGYEADEANLAKLASKEIPEWGLEDGSSVELGRWYTSRRGSLLRIDELLEGGSIICTSHFTGNSVKCPPEQVAVFKPAPIPDNEPGTMLLGTKSDTNISNTNIEDTAKYDALYAKYPHIIDGSIYRVKNTSGNKNPKDLELEKIMNALQETKGDHAKAAAALGLTYKKLIKRIAKLTDKKTEIKGQVRCKIRCQEPKCKNERDIKVQDVFQVKKCIDCKKKTRRKKLKKFLNKKKAKNEKES